MLIKWCYKNNIWLHENEEYIFEERKCQEIHGIAVKLNNRVVEKEN